VVAGTVNGARADTTLQANGAALPLDAAGGFAGTVNLGGASTLDLTLSTPATGQKTEFRIPITGTVVPEGALDTVQQALSGLTVGNGTPLTVGGTVLNRDQLASFTVNGADVLGALSRGRSLSLQVPGTSRQVVISVTDHHGTSEATTSSISRPSSTPLRTLSVSATQAQGLKIARVRYFARGVRRTRRVRMVVTVVDGRGYRVQGAKLTIRSTRAALVTRRSQTKRTGRLGQASFYLHLRPGAFGKRLVVVVVGKTPTAKATKRTSARIPNRRR
jgi:hypothetical protein